MYCKLICEKMDLLPSNRLFKFGAQTCRSMGSLNLKIPVPTGVLDLYVDVMETDIPLIVGLD
jgi:hypothetical protein